jgi:hypothetical protein
MLHAGSCPWRAASLLGWKWPGQREVAWAEGIGLGRGGGRKDIGWRDRSPYCQVLGPIHYMAPWRSIITQRQTWSLGPLLSQSVKVARGRLMCVWQWVHLKLSLLEKLWINCLSGKNVTVGRPATIKIALGGSSVSVKTDSHFYSTKQKICVQI